MKVPLLDLRAQYDKIRDEVQLAANRVFESQYFILGDEVAKFEESVARYSRARYGVGCASGSDALTLAMMALGIRPDDEVVTVSYTFFATAGEIALLGAVPVFVDVDDRTFNMDVAQLAEVLRTRPKIRAIMPVHLFGGCADMEPILALATQHGVPVIEDAAQAIGSEYQGRRAGSMGALGCFSFFPSKNLGGFGDGGMLTTDDEALAGKLKILRMHGRTGKYIHEVVGRNSRLDALQAAILQVKLAHLDGWTEGRRKNADTYRELLKSAPVVPPVPAEYQTRHIYNQFVIRCPRRDELQAYLREHGVGSEVYYPLPLHLQNCFSSLGYKAGDFPVSERLSRETLALPIHSELSHHDIEYVCERIRQFYT
ncbi:MAG: DegT/DnrJ/EryC1/StrS family aminotransferase [Bryobacteraceae bacterium]